MGSGAVCVTPSGSTSGTGTVGATTLNISPPSGLTVGELVSGSGSDSTGTVQVQSGAEIASISSSSITITLPLFGTATDLHTPLSVSFTGSNGGTLIVDAGGDCYQKSDYRGEPHEFGAYGDYNVSAGTGHDDTVAIQNWLGAYGNVSGSSYLGPGTAPLNFGPWIASIPANYLISQPLFCPPNATIQGNENLANNIPKNATNFNPRVNFIAAPATAAVPFSGYTYTSGPISAQFFGSQAVFGTLAYCRFSGIAVTGNGFKLPTIGNTHGTTTIDGLHSVANVQIGNAVVGPSAGSDIKPETVVTSVSPGPCPCTVTVSQQTTGSGTTGESITFYGPDTVDVLADRLTIDGFSSLNLGRYDLFCGVLQNGGQDGISLKDTSFQNALLDDIHIPGPCSNVRIIGDIVSHAGADGILFGATEADIEGGVIEESGNAGLDLVGADRVSVTGMHIQGNGTANNGGAQGAGIAIKESRTITITGNHLEGDGGDTPVSSEVYFAKSGQSSDNVTLSANVYEIENAGNTADVTPTYIYDGDSGVSLTNVHIYETAEQPAVSVFSPNAQAALASAVVPQFTQNQISGLNLQNDSINPGFQIDVLPGSAVDSSGSNMIQLTQTCTIDLKNVVGAGGLDAATFAANTTYYIFAIAPGAAGSSPANCMASASLVPQFTAPSFSGTGYVQSAMGGTASGSNILYNVNPLNGVATNDVVQSVGGTSLPPGSAITAFSSNLQPPTQPTVSGTWTGGTTIPVSTVTGVQLGMAAVDTGPNSCFPQGTYVTATNPTGPTLTVSQVTTSGCNEAAGTTIDVSGARQIAVGGYSASSSAVQNIEISIGSYRLIGAVYTTNATTPTLVSFTQDNDTFYLQHPGPDITSPALGNVATPFALNSVPLGVPVEAFGRCTANNKVHIFSQGQSPGTPAAFPTVPGFDTLATLNLQTAFPFRAYTDTNRQIYAQANGPSTTLFCMTDGWVFHR